jgi:ubiquinone/menaquinone biosynthesis C-methylase UbiE
MYRLLRALTSKKIFAELEDGTFRLTPSGELLRVGVPNSVRDVVLFMGEEWHWRVWGHLLYSVQTGKAAWEHVHGSEIFTWLAEHPEEGEVFNRAMTAFSQSAASAIVEAYDFSGLNVLADIAGGHGRLLSGILASNPRLKGILFDQPQVIEGAGKIIERNGLSGRIELVTGDFFESIPAGADAYLMKHIIHDWDDERAVKILRNIQRVIPQGGKLLLAELVVPIGNDPHFSKIMDLEMLVSPGGRERTASEFESLFAQSSFRLTRVIPTASPLCIIEGVKTDEA